MAYGNRCSKARRAPSAISGNCPGVLGDAFVERIELQRKLRSKTLAATLVPEHRVSNVRLG
jgi:hypothetical protein